MQSGPRCPGPQQYHPPPEWPGATPTSASRGPPQRWASVAQRPCRVPRLQPCGPCSSGGRVYTRASGHGQQLPAPASRWPVPLASTTSPPESAQAETAGSGALRSFWRPCCCLQAAPPHCSTADHWALRAQSSPHKGPPHLRPHKRPTTGALLLGRPWPAPGRPPSSIRPGSLGLHPHADKGTPAGRRDASTAQTSVRTAVLHRHASLRCRRASVRALGASPAKH
mmetsp:Transcript_82415/g.191438  ORF Transcript_82415/g.191438 Transcript_82415/m.191438 type:complete len:225 (+) Transcript_82415:197-871(+)